MSIRQPSPSPLVRDLAQRICRDISPAALKVATGKLDQVRAALRAAHPLKVYFLGTQALAEHTNLRAAIPVGWRFLILRGKRAVAATEITLAKREGGPRWVYTSYDSRQHIQLQTIERMISDSRLVKRRYELRFLRIPGLDLNGLLWLHSAGGADDRIVQLGTSSMLRAGWQYSVEQLLARLRPHAERRRQRQPKRKRPISGSSGARARTGPLVKIQPAGAGRKTSRRGKE